MNVAVGLLLYAIVLTWGGPPLLNRITNRGTSPRLGVAVWLAAIVGALGAWMVAVTVLVVEAFHSGGVAVTFCLEALGYAGQVGTPPRLGAPASAVIATIGIALTAAAGRGILRRIQRSQCSSNQHAQAARIIGRPTKRPGVLVVESCEPVAYCVAGHPRTIVVTSAVLERLSETQLAAVLAHEHAHITGRHHQLLMVLRAVASCLPRLPLFVHGAAATARLLEMCADDAAVREFGSRPLLGGLMTLAARPAPATALGAADTAVLARATRLARPPARLARWRQHVVLSASLAVTGTAPVLTAMLCHH